MRQEQASKPSAICWRNNREIRLAGIFGIILLVCAAATGATAQQQQQQQQTVIIVFPDHRPPQPAPGGQLVPPYYQASATIHRTLSNIQTIAKRVSLPTGDKLTVLVTSPNNLAYPVSARFVFTVERPEENTADKAESVNMDVSFRRGPRYLDFTQLGKYKFLVVVRGLSSNTPPMPNQAQYNPYADQMDVAIYVYPWNVIFKNP